VSENTSDVDCQKGGAISQIGKECICANGFIWANSLNRCIRNCSEIPGSQFTSDGKCTCNLTFVFVDNNCQWGFLFNRPFSNSGQECGSLLFAMSNPNNVNSCLCVTGYYWNLSGCVRNCSQDIYSDGKNLGPLNCSCK
jgi:hypothetical protein